MVKPRSGRPRQVRGWSQIVSSREEFKRKVRARVRELIETRSVEADYARGRRRSDIMLVVVKGAKSEILKLPMDILEQVDQVDVELLAADSRRPENSSLTFMVTEVLAKQPSLHSERRAKLKRSLREAAGDQPPGSAT